MGFQFFSERGEMIQDFPSNSVNAPRAEEKRVEKVIVGDVITRKPALGKRFYHTFFGGDAQGVVGYVLMDVLVPAVRDIIVDVAQTAVERLVFGEGRAPSRRNQSYRPGGSSSHGSYVSYNRYAAPSSPFRREEPTREISRRARATHDFDEIVLATRAEAQEVINRLFDLVSQYEQATVAELMELVGLTPQHTDYSYGWTDIRGAGITRVRDGYLLDLPRAIPLK